MLQTVLALCVLCRVAAGGSSGADFDYIPALYIDWTSTHGAYQPINTTTGATVSKRTDSRSAIITHTHTHTLPSC
jgi:hypothetical protein